MVFPRKQPLLLSFEAPAEDRSSVVSTPEGGETGWNVAWRLAPSIFGNGLLRQRLSVLLSFSLSCPLPSAGVAAGRRLSS